MIQLIDETAQDLRTLVEAGFGPLKPGTSPGTSLDNAIIDWLNV